MDFLSEQLVASDYLERLRLDLQQADLCRFSISHISEAGLDSIGRSEIRNVLRQEGSFGIGSLTRSCGYKPLLKLQREIGAESVRLKYFMDPMVRDTKKADEIILFHSKIVFLRLRAQQKSVVYVGSHNWVEGALGPSGPRTVEASVRFEEDFSPEQLTGNAASVVGQVNRHLLAAFNNPLCLPSTPYNESIFEQWVESANRRAKGDQLRKTTIVLAVQKSPPTANREHWSNLSKRGLYFQVLEENEGGMVVKSSNKLVVMVWDSRADLQAGITPVMLRCRVSAFNAGPNSKYHGTNKSSPMAGFAAAIYDEGQLRKTRGSWLGPRSSLEIWSGRDVQFFDFERREAFTSSQEIDGEVRPNYQFHLEVDHIVFPADRALSDAPEMLWTPQSFAVAEGKEKSRLRQVKGYPLPQELRGEILAYLKDQLHVDTKKAKNLPVEELDRGKSGRLLSNHPLHETFINQSARDKRGTFYERTKPGWLVAELDRRASEGRLFPELIRRVQQLFTTNLDLLEKEWASIARDARASNEQREAK
jgi:hypothetical protein